MFKYDLQGGRRARPETEHRDTQVSGGIFGISCKNSEKQLFHPS